MAGTAHAVSLGETRLALRERHPAARVGAALWQFARRKPVGAFAGLIVVGVILSGIFADQLAPKNPIATSPINSLTAPGSTFKLGTDIQGRDVLSRIIHGARISVGVGVGAVVLGVSVGTLAGLVSGYFGGWLDTLLQRVIDMLMAFPTLILAMAIVAAAGTARSGGTTETGLLGALDGLWLAVRNNMNLVLAIGITLIPGAARLVRSTVLTVKENQYVEAARSLGASDVRLMTRHVLPNVVAPVIVLISVVIGQAIISEASLSFLGLGAQEPTPSWGQMLSSAQRYLERAPWLVIFPGLAIAIVVYAFNMFGDALRDVLDPRLRGQD
jgi:peptide/nickel transport system permease protein